MIRVFHHHQLLAEHADEVRHNAAWELHVMGLLELEPDQHPDDLVLYRVERRPGSPLLHIREIVARYAHGDWHGAGQDLLCAGLEGSDCERCASAPDP